MARPTNGRPRGGDSRRTPSRSGTSRRTTRRASSSSSGSQTALIGGIAAVVVIVAVIFVLSRGSSPAAAAAGEASEARTKPPAAAPSQPPADAPDLSSGTARAGKTPDRPAPPIDPADLRQAEEHYQAGKASWNDGQRARTAGDQTAYADALDAAFGHLEKQREVLRPYTDWFEEADFGDWAMPAEYDVLQRKLDEYDRLYQRVKKLKQVR